MKQLTKTKIVATLGPSSDTKEKIEELVEAGVTMFRLNSSHGDEEQHLRNIKFIRQIEKEKDILIPILLDLQGPKIRVGDLPEAVELVRGQVVKFKHRSEFLDDGIIPFDYEGIAKDAKVGEKIMLDDGKLVLEVTSISGDIISAKVIAGGMLKKRKGINIPGSTGSVKALTERDKGFVKFALAHEVDYLGLSFVRNAQDVLELRHLMEELNGKAKVISKIEKPQALENIDEIIAKSTGIMVARGDLGIEISPEKVPIVQKEIIKKANAQRKVVIVATQMLESMIEQPIPTRAEASDVANAILDGTDAIMLSGETASGLYPVEAVRMMKSIANEVESSKFLRKNYYSKYLEEQVKDDSIAICSAIVDMVEKVNVKAILAFTATGYTAKLLSKAKPSVPIFAVCPNMKNCRRIKLFYDVYAVDVDANIEEITAPEILKKIDKHFKETFGLKNGDKIIFTGAVPNLLVGKTNFIKLHEIGMIK